MESKSEINPLLMKTNENKGRKCFSTRFFVVLISLFGTAIMYITRVNLSIAIVAMVTNHKSSNTTSPEDTCDASAVKNSNSTNSETGEFDWSPIQQSYVLGSFFWGYLALQIVGGRLAEIFGAKWIIALSLFVSGIINILTPVIARWNFIALIVSRVVLGLFQGVLYPSFYCLFAKWIPEEEHSTFLPWLDAGVMIGTVIASAGSGKMIYSGFLGGWPSAFYVAGLLALLWCVLWVSYVTSYPSAHRYITKSELDYIKQHTQTSAEVSKRKSFPWLTVLTSVPFHAVLLVKLTYGITFDFVMSKLPAYLQDVINVPIDQNGYIFAAAMIAFAVTLLTCGYLADLIIAKTFLDKTDVRKVFQTIAGVGMILSLISIPYAGCNKPIVILLFVSCMLSYGFTSGGDVPIVPDMTIDYAGTTFAIMNTICSISGFVTPYMVGLIINRNPYSITLWSYVFLLLAIIVIIGTIGFLCYASAEPQHWAHHSDSDTVSSQSHSSVNNINNSKDSINHLNKLQNIDE